MILYSIKIGDGSLSDTQAKIKRSDILKYINQKSVYAPDLPKSSNLQFKLPRSTMPDSLTFWSTTSRRIYY